MRVVAVADTGLRMSWTHPQRQHARAPTRLSNVATPYNRKSQREFPGVTCTNGVHKPAKAVIRATRSPFQGTSKLHVAARICRAAHITGRRGVQLERKTW
jgi:hypothetical protein